MEETMLIDGINVSYRVEGKGEPLLLIHGMAFSHDIWSRTIDAASRSFTVFALDLPGFGCSDKPAIEYGLSFYVEFIKRFLDALKIERCAIAGMSMGGEISAAFAAKYPGRVSHLIIVNSKGFSPLIKGIRTLPVLGSPMYIFMFNSRGVLKRYIENMLYDKRALNEEFIDKEWARIKDPAYRRSLSGNTKYFSTIDQELPGLLKNITAKTLIIWGKDDALLPIDDAYKFNECIEGSKLVVLDRCGHVPVIEKNEAFNKALLTFLGQVDLYYASEGK